MKVPPVSAKQSGFGGTMLIFRSASCSASRRLVVAALLCVCSAASAQDLAGEEGIVIGTVVVKVADPDENSSFLRGARKLEKIKWALTIKRAEGLTFSNRYIKVASGSEEHFLVKLKAGSYHFDQLVAQGFANFYFPVQVRFEVTPKSITYIGRLEITLPYRMCSAPASFNVVDSQEETVAALRNDNPELVTGVSKSLMRIGE